MIAEPAADLNVLYTLSRIAPPEVSLLSRKNGIALLLGIAVGIFLLMLCIQVWRPLLLIQPASYHDFADKRAWLGIPNFLNVASNFPFAVLGIWGVVFVARHNSRLIFLDQRERWPYFGIFFGLFLTPSARPGIISHRTTARLYGIVCRRQLCSVRLWRQSSPNELK